MAATVRSHRSRTIWEAMAMARVPEVHMRITRILDETRTIPRPFGRRSCAALLACGLPFICAVSVLQLAPAKAMPQSRTAAEAGPPPQSAVPQAPAKQLPPVAPAVPLNRIKAKNDPPVAGLQPFKPMKPGYPAAAIA